ncbi:thrombospondin type 3 repeat-containing protein [Patescibacteria group bacterium]|nr:thrombospondin type 3 repeat-containing protein [Patescibacteria group bacterium]MBU1034558.1 thrombospondin type 3 repeat-containing protein [Patescibacteria group bacterium]MBU1629791.1 thrombospondin type 3 repeat-containing protein [Patescibacteria group bacterium]MBU1908376.1 thrombospondin type 3 repeat-containing protein [Patescibacteria group bacterium]
MRERLPSVFYSFAGFFALLLACFILQPQPVLAACDISISSGDVITVPSNPIVNRSVKLYATVDPKCGIDVEGTIAFSFNGQIAASEPFSYRAGGLAEEVWATWTPSQAAKHELRIDVKAAGLADAVYEQSIYVDSDSDNDGVGNSFDTDDDNDGVPDSDDDFPLDDSRSAKPSAGFTENAALKNYRPESLMEISEAVADEPSAEFVTTTNSDLTLQIETAAENNEPDFHKERGFVYAWVAAVLSGVLAAYFFFKYRRQRR